MKKLFWSILMISMISAMLAGCGFKNEFVDNGPPPEALETSAPESGITKEMAYEGVYNYCHSEYDWSIAEENPSIMYVEMGEETETAYQVIFRSYTGAFVYFYVDKETGSTRMVEYVPTLNTENEAGTIDLYDYLPKHDSAAFET